MPNKAATLPKNGDSPSRAHGGNRAAKSAQQPAALSGADSFPSQLDFQLVFASHPEAMVVLDLHRRIRMCNPAFENLFQHREAEILGAELDVLLACDEHQAEALQFSERAAAGEVLRANTRRRRRDGSFVDVQITCVPLRQDGKIVGSAIIMQQIDSTVITTALPQMAISLHAVTDELRDKLVPLNRKYPLRELLDACRNYPGLSNARRITFEYVMLKDVNDSLAEARALMRLVKGIPAKINLIPFNPWPGTQYECSDWEQIEKFSEVIFNAGYASPVRTPRGRDILAACGQLKSATEKLSAPERLALRAMAITD